MKAITLGYHDIVEDLSLGFDNRRKAPRHYALDRNAFRQHLARIREKCGALRVKTLESDAPAGGVLPVYFSFDDGAWGAYDIAAEELERQGWRGHFFIVSSWIGERGFMTGSQIRELWRRGHIIGSHSHTHPSRISHLDQPSLWREWSRSSQVLHDLLGQPVTCASIPNGFYSENVVAAAAQAGLTTLFTSEPTASSWKIGDSLVLGRYAITNSTSARTAAALARGSYLPRWRQATTWRAKKFAKSVGGKTYLRLRASVLARP